MATELEGFRTLLDKTYPDLTEGLRRPPLPVMAFNNSTEFTQFVTPESQRRSETGEPGVYRTDGVRPLIAIDATRWEESSFDVYRNYTETLLSRRPRAKPWLAAGLSEFFATVRIEQRDGRTLARIGTPSATNLDLLRGEKWIPIEHILAADRESPLLRNTNRKSLFEAEAWLLVHWCQLDPTGERRALLNSLTERSRRGGEVEPVFFSPQAETKGWLMETLKAYLNEKQYETYIVDLTETMIQSSNPSVEVLPVEIEYRLGQVLTYRRQFAQAEILFQHALKLNPDAWMPYDGMGLLASANLSSGEARRFFTEAVARQPTNAGPYLDYGLTSRYIINRKSTISSARTAYEKSLALDPSLLEAYAGLADLAYREHNWTESVRWAGRGLQIDPHDSRLRAMLGRAQFAVGDLAHARVNTQLALQECEDHRSCSEAASLVRVALSRL